MAVARGKIKNDGQQFYPTPAWATGAFMEVWGPVIPPNASVWEPACGKGAMSEVIKFMRPDIKVTSTDLHHRGYGNATPIDFMAFNFKEGARKPFAIVTNPPYSQSEDFINHALKLLKGSAPYLVAFFLPLSAACGQSRYKNVFKDNPPTQVRLFCERVTLFPDGAEVKSSGTLEHAWFIWTNIKTDARALEWFAPGTRQRASILAEPKSVEETLDSEIKIS